MKKGDMIGDRKAISDEFYVRGSKQNYSYITVQCKCGKIDDIKVTSFNQKKAAGKCRSCATTCFKSHTNIEKSGKLTPLEYIGKLNNKPCYWLCKCDCGNTCYASTYQIKNKVKTSCGCSRNISGKEHPNWRGTGEISGNIWHIIKNSAKSRNLDFEITPEYIWQLFVEQKGICVLSGIELTFPKNTTEFHKREWNASLDRIDSSRGYVEGNVQWVDCTINFAKQDLSDGDFIALCKKVAEHNK